MSGPAVCFSPHASGLPLPSGFLIQACTVWVKLEYKYRLKIKINDKVLGNGFFGKEASSAPI